MATFPTHLLYLPTSMGGLGLPRLTTYINTRKWCMAQRALTHDDNTAKAVHGLLDRAARYCGSPVSPGQPTGISSTTSTPAWGSSLGAMAGAPSPILLQKGKFTSSATVPLAPYVPQRHGKRHLLTLQQRGLATLGDLTHTPVEGPRQWLPAAVQAALLPVPPPELPPDPPDHHPPPRAGQFWVLKGTHATWGGLYQLVQTASPPLTDHLVQRWVPAGPRPRLCHIPRAGTHLRPLGSPRPLSVVTFASLAYYRTVVHRRGQAPQGTVIASFPDRLLPPPPPSPPWTDIFRDHLDPRLAWRIYADGSWKPDPSPTPDDYFSEPGTHQGGGCIVVTQDTEDWAQGPIYILPFTVPRLATELGGVPMNMELLGISAGLELLDALRLTGTVFSDCQGLVRKTPAGPGFPLFRACVRRLTHPARKLQWIRSHPERSGTPRSGWDQSQWGIFLADLFARAPASTPPLGFDLRIADSIPYQCISEGAIGPEDWHWATAGHAPLLGALRGTVNTLSLSAYLNTRDSARTLRGAPPKWAGTSARFAARLWNLSNRGIAQRGRKVRHIWDLRWHGENRAVANPTQDASLHQCGLCGHPHCGLAHIICECPNLTHARDGARSDLRYFATRQASKPAARVMRRYTQLLFEHPNLDRRGQLWLGHWTPPLRQALRPLLQPLTLREGQAILARILAH